jgi:putative oxidoreductase
MKTDVLMLLIRLALGWYLMLAGWEKVEDELAGGFGTFLESDGYRRRNPQWLPAFIATGYAYVLPWAELVCGGFVMLGLVARAAAIGAAVLFATIGIALYGAGDLLPRHHIMVFLPVALLIASNGPGRYSLDTVISRRK